MHDAWCCHSYFHIKLPFSFSMRYFYSNPPTISMVKRNPSPPNPTMPQQRINTRFTPTKLNK